MDARKILIFLALCVPVTICVPRNMMECHDNFNLLPKDGILKDKTFTWLGFVQYLHVTTGLPHHTKSPRVVLIQKQFALGTAVDMLHLPKNYKVGNVVFGDYDRDEEDCQLSFSHIKMGVKCARAYLEIPFSEITPHPEFSRFGVGNSLALVRLIRPLKSHYMIPVCLPSVGDRENKRKTKSVFIVDYVTAVPRDFETERMGKKTLKLYTHKECRRHRMRSRLGSEGVTHVLCSSGCGMRPGAPIVSHTISGMFEVVGLVAGGAPCRRRSMRRRLNTEPPIYIDVFPYVAWITNVISAHVMPLPYPQSFRRTDSNGISSVIIPRGDYLRSRKRQQHGWKARMYVSGNWCYKSEKKQRRATMFYAERFEVNADPPAKLTMFMKISAGFETTIVCARMLMPNRLSTPVIHGVGGYNISIQFETAWFPYVFYFSLGLTGRNTSQRDYPIFFAERTPGFW